MRARRTRGANRVAERAPAFSRADVV